jgi:exodeoxyribonuclease III
VGAMASALPGYHAHYSLNRDPQNARFRGGRAYGVVTYWKESLGPAIAAVPDWDREGRVVFSRFETFAIANVYAVNGTSRPYFDYALGRFAGGRHAFKRRFQRMVLEHAAKLSPIILAGDWNVSQASIDTHPRLRTEEPHARARAEFRDLVKSARLVDVYRHLHPKAKVADRERSMLRASIFYSFRKILFRSRLRRGSSTIPGSECIPTTRRSV